MPRALHWSGTTAPILPSCVDLVQSLANCIRPESRLRNCLPPPVAALTARLARAFAEPFQPQQLRCSGFCSAIPGLQPSAAPCSSPATSEYTFEVHLWVPLTPLTPLIPHPSPGTQVPRETTRPPFPPLRGFHLSTQATGDGAPGPLPPLIAPTGPQVLRAAAHYDTVSQQAPSESQRYQPKCQYESPSPFPQLNVD